MSKDKELFGEHYNTHFNPDVYVSSYYEILDKTVEEGLLVFLIEKIYHIFSSGPIPHPVVLAIPFVQEIYLTDLSKVKRKYLQDAIFGSGGQTYSKVLQHIASLKDNQKTWTDLSVDLKSKVGGIFSIDLLKENIFVDSYFPLFDVITSSLCIEAAGPNVEAYEDIAKKISACLKPGGHLILAEVLDEKFYMVGEHKFYCLNISKMDLERCWQSAGFSISKWDEMEGPNAENIWNLYAHLPK